MNSSGTATPNDRAMRNASGSEGSYLSVSTALIVCRDTPSHRPVHPGSSHVPHDDVSSGFPRSSRLDADVKRPFLASD
jgi:hypothetical protein